MTLDMQRMQVSTEICARHLLGQLLRREPSFPQVCMLPQPRIVIYTQCRSTVCMLRAQARGLNVFTAMSAMQAGEGVLLKGESCPVLVVPPTAIIPGCFVK